MLVVVVASMIGEEQSFADSPGVRDNFKSPGVQNILKYLYQDNLTYLHIQTICESGRGAVLVDSPSVRDNFKSPEYLENLKCLWYLKQRRYLQNLEDLNLKPT